MPLHLSLLPGTSDRPETSSADCLPHLFHRQAAQTPDAVAVVCKDERLTYRELRQRAAGLARRLAAAGCAPGCLVGLCVERSLDLIVAILGILEAGGAYVPVDPAYPRERLALILEEARVPLLVAQAPLLPRLPDPQARVLLVAEDDGGPPAADSPGPDVCPDDLAYVIYTSGSTGRPKGVPVTHGNVVRLFEATRPLFRFDAADVWTLFHSCAFDFSVWEIWGALLHGGRLVVVPHETTRSARDFYNLLRAEKVTVLSQTPSAFLQLIHREEFLGAAGDLALRLVIFGGEALALPALKPWFDRHGDRRPLLVNMYGITETTVHVTWRPLSRADLEAPGSLIGRPIPGWRVHLLDARGRPVPDGEVGEMYVGGAGVARGYLHRPDLTAERFLPDPFSPTPGARLYRSGDLARRLPDGDLVYLGRGDQQVKVRGFRIELLEIESVLARHPQVAEAAVVAREDVPGEKRLVGYVVGRRPPPEGRELRAFLLDKLPEYMVPGAFVLLERLPLTAHGKVDRVRLPAPPPQRSTAGRDHVPPRTECEQRLQRLWEELLRVYPIGVRDDFFELGGDSLLAMRLFLSVQQRFGCDLPAGVLLEGATIEHLATLIDRPRPAGGRTSLVVLQKGGAKPPFVCVHPLGGQVLGYRVLARHLSRDQPFYALQARELSGPWPPFTRLEELAAHYVGELLQVQPDGPYCLGGYSLGAFIAFEMAQQLQAQGRKVALLAMLDDGPALLQQRLGRTPAELGRFLANVPRWLGRQLRRKQPRQVLADGWRKLRVLGRRLLPGRRQAGQVDVEEVLDVSGYSGRQCDTITVHYRAVREYVPRTYPGRVTVFRARTQPLWRAHRPDLGWGPLAAGGVETHVLRGDHDSIITEPDVQGLARLLAGALGRAAAGV